MYAIAKKEKGSEIDASPQLPISTGVQSLDRSRLPWSVPLDRLRLPRSAIMAVQVQSTDVFLCYQRLSVSCALCNNFQAARPRQKTERRLAPLYVEHMPSLVSSGLHRMAIVSGSTTVLPVGMTQKQNGHVYYRNESTKVQKPRRISYANSGCGLGVWSKM